MRKSTTSILALAAALVVGGATGASAQQSTAGERVTPGTPVDQKASPLPAANDGGLEEIIVTAQKREENVQSAPLSISALSGATVPEGPYSYAGRLGEQHDRHLVHCELAAVE